MGQVILEEKHMAKKLLLVSVLVTIAAAGSIFAQDQEKHFSAGIGLMTGGGRMGSTATTDIDRIGFGGVVFFDATYAEFAFGSPSGRLNKDTNFSSVDFSLLGKYPVTIGSGNISIFPLLGAGYNLMLRVNGKSGGAADYNTFRVEFGAGSDFDLSRNLFMRLELLGNYGFAPEVLGTDADGGLGGTVKIAVGSRF